jgi:hypothetical protein
MTRSEDPFGNDASSLEEWLERIVLQSRTFVDHLAERVDRLVDDVRRDAAEVARSASDLFDDLLRSAQDDGSARPE